MGMKRVGPRGDEGLRKSFGFEVTLSVLFRWYPHTPRREENEKLIHRGTKSQLGGGCKRMTTNPRPGCSAQPKAIQSCMGRLCPHLKKIYSMPQNLGLKIIVMVNGMLYIFYLNKEMINRVGEIAQLAKYFSCNHEDLNLVHQKPHKT